MMKYSDDALNSLAAKVTNNANIWFNKMNDSAMDNLIEKIILVEIDDFASVKMDEEAKDLSASGQQMRTK
eukprot:7625670-Ditylum_brightwellii.AAC.1